MHSRIPTGETLPNLFRSVTPPQAPNPSLSFARIAHFTSVENRWDEKSRSPERDAISSQVIHALEAQENKETGMKKISTTTTKAFRRMEKLTIGLDLGDRSSWYCVLDERGEIVLEQKVSTTPKAMEEVFGGMPRSRIALETGTHSPWVSRL